MRFTCVFLLLLVFLAAPAFADTTHVAVDTTVTVVADTRVYQSVAANNYSNKDSILVGIVAAGSGQSFGLFYFGTIVDRDCVFVCTSATFNAYTTTQFGIVDATPDITLYPLSGDWLDGDKNAAAADSDETNYTRPGWSTVAGTLSVTGDTLQRSAWIGSFRIMLPFDTITFAGADTSQWFAWDCLGLVQRLTDTTKWDSNFGICAYTSSGTGQEYIAFRTKENAGGLQPYLHVMGYYVVTTTAQDSGRCVSGDSCTWTIEDSCTAWGGNWANGWPCDTVNYVNDDSCVGAWYMNGATSRGETDRSGEGHTLTARYSYIGYASSLLRTDTLPPSYTGASRRFRQDLASSRLETTTAGTLNINGANALISIAEWIKPMSVPDSGSYQTSVSKWSATGNTRQYRLSNKGSGSGQFAFSGAISANGDTATLSEVLSTSSTYEDSAWYFVVFTSNDDSLRLFINGVLACTPVAHTTGIASTIRNFTLGAQHDGVAPFNGYLDEVAIFNRCLSAAEIYDIYLRGLTGSSGASDLPLYTSFCSTDGITPDSSTVVADLADSLTAFIAANPTWTLDTLGQSAQDSNLLALVYEPAGYTRTVFADGAIHGNAERITAIAMLNLAEYLADSADTQFPHVRWVIVPLVNPDGAAANTRKNNNLDSARTVDLNRNFSVGWSEATGTEPADYDYKGPRPFSETESIAIRDALIVYDPDIYFNDHTNSNLIWVASPADVVNITNLNSYLATHNFEPHNSMVSTDSGSGFAFMYADSLGAKSYVYEYSRTTANIEEINRNIASIITMTERMQYTPVLDSVTIAGLEATLYWSENEAPDSIRIIRDAMRVAVVDSGVFTYSETVPTYGNYRYTLLAFFCGGQVSDSSNTILAETITSPIIEKDPSWRTRFRQKAKTWIEAWR